MGMQTEIQFIYVVRDILILLFCLGAMAGAVPFFQSGRSRIGSLIVVGFGLLTLEPISDFVVWQFLIYTDIDSALLDWLFACPSAFGMIGGVVCLAIAFFLSIQPEQSEADHTDS